MPTRSSHGFSLRGCPKRMERTYRFVLFLHWTAVQAKAVLLHRATPPATLLTINKRRDKSRLYRNMVFDLIFQFITVSFGFVDLIEGIGIIRGGRIERFSFAGVSVGGKSIDDGICGFFD